MLIHLLRLTALPTRPFIDLECQPSASTVWPVSRLYWACARPEATNAATVPKRDLTMLPIDETNRPDKPIISFRPPYITLAATAPTLINAAASRNSNPGNTLSTPKRRESAAPTSAAPTATLVIALLRAMFC